MLGPTQRSVSQENAFKKSKKSSPRPSPFSRKTIIGSGTFSKVGGGGLKSKMVIKPSRHRGCLSRGVWPPSEAGAFLNEAIWCTIFHHVKHLTVCLMGCLLLYNRIVKKVEGPCHCPPASRFCRLYENYKLKWFFYSNWKQFQVLKTTKFEFKVTVHYYSLWAKCTPLWALNSCNSVMSLVVIIQINLQPSLFEKWA